MMKMWSGAVQFSLVVGLAGGCASEQVTSRTANDPVGEAIEYGAPEGTVYMAEMDASRDYGNVVVYKKSVCKVIPVTVVQSYKETLRGDEVLERTPVTKRQVAGEPTGEVPCDQTYARDVEVLLEADGGRFSLGRTDATGRVATNLAKIFQVASFEEVPSEAKILVRPQKAQPLVEVSRVSLEQLKKHEVRVNEKLGKLKAILEKGETGASPEEITRSYELYNQLVDLAPSDPRILAVASRFWELFYGRKQEEARERMGKNLDALSKAQSTLKAMGDAALPIYVQAAVSSGTLDRRALEWSSLRLIRALRGSPAVCSGGFSWTSVPSYGWPKEAELAAQYAQFAYGAAHAEVVGRACRSF